MMASTLDDLYNEWEVKYAPASGPLPIQYFGQITPSVDVRDFVQGLLMEGSSAVLYGESNSGKTFLATSIALAVASGLPWFGRRVERGGVLYLALEGGQGFRNRVAAWAERHDTVAPVHFAAIPSQVNLLDPEADTQRVIDACTTAADHMCVKIKLIVVDTLARAMAGGNENASEDMGAMVRNMDRIRDATGAMVLFIHHSGKDAAKGARGHSSLRAAIDTEIEVEATDGPVRRATVVKQRDMKKGDVFPFQLEVIEIGQNRHGESVTTCLVQEMDAEAITPRRIDLKGHAKRAFDALNDILAASGQTGFTGVPSETPSIPEEWWRQRFYEKMVSDEGDTSQSGKRKAFARAVTDLQDAKLVGVNKGRVWSIYGGT
jgi:RecA/RadA recombinase